MDGKETQINVGCSVPFCEETYCNRKFKKRCALRKYFLYEVVNIRKQISHIIQFMGLHFEKEFLNKKYFWRNHGSKRISKTR